jgi:signal recognition particle GTPase
VQDVNRLLKQYAQLRKMMKGVKSMGRRGGLKQLRRTMPFLET